MEKIIQFKPIYKEKIWGGRKIESALNRIIPDGKIGESWEISDYGKDISIAMNGSFAGLSLRDIYNSHREEVLGNMFLTSKGFPLLVKIIDAEDRLSIQVHPDDEYAEKFDPTSFGKKESWLILHAEPNANIICGFNNPLSKEEYNKKIIENRAEEDLQKWDVRSGDAFLISPGTIHAICPGNLILEVQQSSDSTYRVYDYGRLGDDGKPRELHIKKSLDVLNFNKSTGSEKLKAIPIDNGRELLEYNDKFRFEKFTFSHNTFLPLMYSEPAFQIVSVISGSFVCESISFKRGDTFLATAYGLSTGLQLQSNEKVELALFGPGFEVMGN
jgi:mannose-6-phosphate isomerase